MSVTSNLKLIFLFLKLFLFSSPNKKIYYSFKILRYRKFLNNIIKIFVFETIADCYFDILRTYKVTDFKTKDGLVCKEIIKYYTLILNYRRQKQKADLIHVLYRISYCYTRLGLHFKAISYLQELNKLTDNKNTLFSRMLRICSKVQFMYGEQNIWNLLKQYKTQNDTKLEEILKEFNLILELE